MNELDKAYEDAEMLKALGLPISKEQLYNIERLEKESGREHRNDLKSYFYEQCFAIYTKQIINIRQAKIRGEVILAKPVLLLAVIEGIESEVFISNRFPLKDWLEKRYMWLMQKYMRNSQFDNPTDISNPYWHLQSDGFWHLEFIEKPKYGVSPSKAWLKKNVEYAYFDDSLWMLLQNKVWRTKLRDYIIEHKLTDDFWSGKMVAESLGIIAAVLLAS